MKIEPKRVLLQALLMTIVQQATMYALQQYHAGEYGIASWLFMMAQLVFFMMYDLLFRNR